jgi:hypothetical protein
LEGGAPAGGERCGRDQRDGEEAIRVHGESLAAREGTGEAKEGADARGAGPLEVILEI